MKRIAIALLSLACFSASAELMTGNKLLDLMNGPADENAAAIGYVIGVADTTNSILVCAPGAATAGQMYDMVKAYLTNAPAIRHLSGDRIVVRVLSAAWPCAPKAKGGNV